MWTSYITQYKGNQSDFWEVKVIRDDIISGVECGGHQDKQNVRRKKCSVLLRRQRIDIKSNDYIKKKIE